MTVGRSIENAQELLFSSWSRVFPTWTSGLQSCETLDVFCGLSVDVLVDLPKRCRNIVGGNVLQQKT